MSIPRFAAIRLAVAIVVAASLNQALSAAVTDTSGFVRRSSKTITTAGVTRPFGVQEGVVAVSSGPNYWLVWLDRRQGGVIMAARILGGPMGVPAGADPRSVRLAEPLGIPIAVSDVPPIAALETAGGGVVLVQSGSSVEAITLPDRSGQVRTVFTLADAGRFIASNRKWALFQSGSTLTLVNGDGTTVRRSGLPEVAGALITEDRLFVVTREQSALTLWEASPSLQLTRLTGGIETFSSGTVQLASTGSEIVVVSSSPSGPTPFSVSRVSTATGVVMNRFSGTIPTSGTLRRVSWNRDRGYVVQWRTASGSWLVETDGASIQTQYGVNGLVDYLSLASLSVYDRGLDGISFDYGGSAYANLSTGGYPITFAPQPEQLVDAASGVDEVALLWYEVLPVEKKQQLWFGMYAKWSGELLHRTQLTDEPYDPQRPPSGAVALRDRIMIVAWTDANGLWYQRLHADGIWMDKSPRLLRPRGPGVGPLELTPNGLDTMDSSFVVVWSEWKDGRTAGLEAAVVGSNGVVTQYTVNTTPFSTYPGRAAVAPTRRGFAIAWSDLSATVPPIAGQQAFPAYLSLYDDRFAFSQNLTPAGGLNTVNAPAIASGGGTLLVLEDLYAFLYNDAGLATWASPRLFDLSADATQFTDRAPHSSIVWTGAEYLVATHAFHRPDGPAALVTFISPEGTLVRNPVPPVPDLTNGEVLKYTPHGFLGAGGLVLLFGSEVLDDPDDGTVRRVRVSTFGTPVRRRSVRK